MEPLQRALEPYRHLDPAGWVNVYRALPTWGAVAALALGVVMLLFGGRRLFRLVAGPLGALVAAVWGGVLAQRLGLGASAQQVSTPASVALLLLGLFFPPIVVFCAFGIPLGLLGGQLAGQTDWLMGFLPGVMVGGALGVVLHRPVAAVLSAAVGAWLCALGLMAALRPVMPLVDAAAAHPLVVVSAAGCLALAGVVFQLFIRPSEEEAEKRKHEQVTAKKRAKEQAEQERRWAKYSDRTADPDD
jgi:hypothetical protein